MALVYTGPFSTADIPAGQRIAGWSNNATGAGVRARYRDGDPQSSFAWREIAGNLNYALATSRRLVCALRFNYNVADPTKSNTGTDWTARAAVYTVLGPFELMPNVRRGIDQPCRLIVRVRARRTGGAGTHKVRLYAIGREHDVGHGWPFTGDRVSGFVNFDITSGTYPATPGFSAEGTLTIPTDPPNWYCAWQRWTHPEPAAAATIEAQDVDVLATYFVLAAIGDGAGNGTYVAGLEVWEEAPAA